MLLICSNSPNLKCWNHTWIQTHESEIYRVHGDGGKRGGNCYNAHLRENLEMLKFQWNIPKAPIWSHNSFAPFTSRKNILHNSNTIPEMDIVKQTVIGAILYRKCTAFLFQDSTGKHVYAQLEACTCSTEARTCSTGSVHMHNWSVYMLMCRC